jgi:hypothetical protein
LRVGAAAAASSLLPAGHEGCVLLGDGSFC